jgi:hypothetical protein
MNQWKTALFVFSITAALSGCQLDSETLKQIYSTGRAPTEAELPTLVGIYQGTCAFQPNPGDSKENVSDSAQPLLVFSYSRISDDYNKRVFYGANFDYPTVEGFSDKLKTSTQGDSTLSKRYLYEVLTDFDDFYSSTGKYRYNNNNGVVGAYAKFADNAYVCGSENGFTGMGYEKGYATSFRVTKDGALVTKVTSADPQARDGYCYWYGKLVDRAELPSDWQGPTSPLN